MPKKQNIFIGRRIRQIRGKRSQAEMGELIGVDGSTVSKYESGRVPPYAVVEKLAEIGKVTVGWILEGEEFTQGRSVTSQPGNLKEEAPRLDEKLLTDIIIMLEECLTELGVHLAPAKKGSLVVHIYRRYAETALPVSKGTVRSYIDLVL